MEVEQDPTAQTLADIATSVDLLEKAVVTLETRFSTRALRLLGNIRPHLSVSILVTAIQNHLKSAKNVTAEQLFAYLNHKASVEGDKSAKTCLPEVELFMGLLVILFLHDSKEFMKGREVANILVGQIQSLNRRQSDLIAARIYFYFSRFFEVTNDYLSVRGLLMHAHRLATIREDEECLAQLSNLLLRNYIHFNHYDQAEKLISKITFPESATTNQMARFMYYNGNGSKTYFLGRIKTILLDYTAAHNFLQQALRKAPQTAVAAGFIQSIQKLLIVVELLMGDIPDRSIFRQPMLKRSLVPYLQITKAVRSGDLAAFQEVLTKFSSVFKQDKTYTLILRLRHNVIKTGIRTITLSYSRISLKDICLKLQLDSEEDAEYIVAKAIRDGVIDAVIDHEHGYIKSRENVDVYSTQEPQNAFHQRISFCLNLHNESIKALRFPNDDETKKALEQAEELLEEDRKLAADIVEGELDDEDDGMDF